MSRFLIVTWDGAGNLVSTLGIAERLADDGHDVRLLGHRSIQQRYGTERWRFRGFGHAADFDSTRSLNVESEIPMHARRIWFSDSVARDVGEELEREPVDVLVADCLLAAALSRGQAAGVADRRAVPRLLLPLPGRAVRRAALRRQHFLGQWHPSPARSRAR